MFYSVTIGGSVLIIGIIAAIVLIVRRKMRKYISQ
jgi:cellobiose-specific phosphotransferase system component IIC